MSQELEDGEFWLPSDFLTDDDDDLLLDINFKPQPLKTKKAASSDFCHCCASSPGFNWDLSSPVDSVTGSTGTESDEDDSVAGLAREMARSAFLDSDSIPGCNRKNGKLSSSPQSTLCGCRREPRANRVSRVPPPPAAPAGKTAEKQMWRGTTPFQSANPFAPPMKPGSVYSPAENSNLSRTEAQARLAHLQLQAVQVQTMAARGLPMAAWPSLQQQQQFPSGSGTRPVFLGETGLNIARTGTGVFLPRPNGSKSNPTETRGKQAATIPFRLRDKAGFSWGNRLEHSKDWDRRVFTPTEWIQVQPDRNSRETSIGTKAGEEIRTRALSDTGYKPALGPSKTAILTLRSENFETTPILHR
ncbi:Unknown protein [Striga hermonthica]|uniref:Uncharacterized protein n=1 Tax=Striga hermonthica TaxID=68872 RepID=A0A9N7NB11_STRHE|nr:Unknown protein [Striga hermonthica]